MLEKKMHDSCPLAVYLLVGKRKINKANPCEFKDMPSNAKER